MDFLKEDNGKISFTRLTGFMLVLMYMFAFIYKLLIDNEVIDIPPMLGTFIAALYGINKLSNAMQNKLQN